MSSLLDARLTVPQPEVSAIPRGRVVALLDDAVRNHPVTLVTGGAGTGKTLAVAAWAADPPWPTAWVSIDHSLRSPGQMWTAVLLALRRALPAELEGLPVPEVVDEEFVELLAESLEGLGVCLVLDDVHELDRSVTWDGLDHLLRLHPAGLHLVLVARHDPPLALHRLRVAGGLGEVRAADLAFTDEEARGLLHERAIVLPKEEFRTLMSVTEGWAAGLRLAVMTLESAPEPVTAVRQFGGGQPLVAGYLVEEVLRGLGPDRGEFMLRTCVCDRVCGPLARALTGDKASAQVLQEMAAENALVSELHGSGWFRYHPLLLQLLRAHLRADNPGLEPDLHRRAAAWHESRGEWLTALDHALASEDWDFVGQVAMRSAVVLVFGVERAAFTELLRRIPAEVARANPELQVALAFAAFSRADAGQPSSATARIAALPEPRRSLATLNVRMLQALAARDAGDAPALATAATAAIAALEHIRAEDAPGWAFHRGTPRAIGAIGELWCGRPLHARTLFRESLTSSRPSDLDGYGGLYHRGYVALAEMAAGRIATARELARTALDAGEPMGATIRRESAAAWLALAATEVYRGDAQAAERALNFGALAADRGRDPFVAAGLRIVAARRAILLGDLPGARHRLTEVDSLLTASPGMILIARLRTALRVDVELAAGATERARQVLAAHDQVWALRAGDRHDTATEPDFLAVPRARVLLAGGHPEQVRDAVAGVLGQAGTGGAEAWLVVALAEDRLRRDAASTEALARALHLGATEDAAYPFLRPGDRLAAMLRRHDDVVGTHRAFVADVLATAAHPGQARSTADAPPEPLTERELTVLAHLPSMSSNGEIAEALGISVNTVKQHLKAIHRKLGVTSRRDAVRVARRFGVLPDRPGSSGR